MPSVRSPWILTVREGNHREMIEDGVVAWDGAGIISFVGKASDAPNELVQGAEVLPPQSVLIPGLINCHTHCAMTLLRGFADDLDLMTWLTKYIWPTEMKYAKEDFVRFGSEIGVMEMLKTGTTTFCDMYFHSKETVQVAVDAGMRIACGDPVINFGDQEGEDRTVKAAGDLVEWLRQHPGCNEKDPRVIPLLEAHSCLNVSHNSLVRLKEAQEKMDSGLGNPIGFHIHLHEDLNEMKQYKEKSGGDSAISTLHSLGLLNNRLIAAHCVHLSDDEIHLLSSSGASAVHCPRSNLKLANGIARVKDMLEGGVNVALGTDGACSNNTLDVLTEMQYASLLAKSQSSDAKAIDCHSALRLATLNGAKALGIEGRVGSIEKGKLADLVSVDLRDIECQPLFDPASALVYCNRREVKEVWVGGEKVVGGGKVKKMELDTGKLEEWREKLLKFRNEECPPILHTSSYE